MRLLALFKKTMIENFRDWKIIVFVLVFAPFFVFLMHFYLKEAVTTFSVVVVNRDVGGAAVEDKAIHAGDALIAELAKLSTPEGAPVLEISREESLERAKRRLVDKSADLVVEIPEDFSRRLLEYAQTGHGPAVRVKSWGDAGSAKYVMAAAYCDYLAYQYASTLVGWEGPLVLEPETIGPKRATNDFGLYVPAMLAMAVIMLMFTAAASIIREKDKETLVRLRISPMRIWEFLLSIGLSQLFIGLLAILLTLGSAMLLGYRTSGSLLAILTVGGFSCLAIIAISVIVAAWLRTIFDLMTIGCFPFFLLLIFSGGMFPLPQLPFFHLAGRAVTVNDLLPTTHSISALGKIMNFGAGLGDVGYELIAMFLLTVVYAAIGIWLFRRRHLKAR